MALLERSVYKMSSEGRSDHCGGLLFRSIGDAFRANDSQRFNVEKRPTYRCTSDCKDVYPNLAVCADPGQVWRQGKEKKG